MGQMLHMETTKVEVSKTCAEIEDVLVKHGAREVWKQYNDRREVEGLEFFMRINDAPLYFKLPFRWQEIQRLAKNGKTGSRRTADEAQARRVAVRLVLRWVQAQFALVETGMVKMEEVFLPYVTVPDGRTYFEVLETTGGLLALNSGKKEDDAIDVEVEG